MPQSPLSPSTHRSQLVKAGKELVERHHQLLGRALRGQAGEALDVCEEDAARRKSTGWGWPTHCPRHTPLVMPLPNPACTPVPTVPDVVMLLDVDLVEHHVLLLGVDVLLHLHGHVLRQH